MGYLSSDVCHEPCCQKVRAERAGILWERISKSVETKKAWYVETETTGCRGWLRRHGLRRKSIGDAAFDRMFSDIKSMFLFYGT